MSAITTSEFAAELDTDTRTARKFLRAITPADAHPGKGARWNIDGTKRSLTKMKKQFSEWSAAQVKADEVAAEVAEEVTVTEVDTADEPTTDELTDIDAEDDLEGLDD